MFFYIIYGHQIAEKYKYLPEFSDSVYFLGFSFTLLSLLGATVFEKLEGDPEKTISYFGMALSTTILGLLYRNWHMQFTEVGEEPSDKAKRVLQQEVTDFLVLSDNLKTSMRGISESFEQISDFPGNVKSIAENFDHTVERSFNDIKTNYEKLGEKSKVMLSEINKSVDNIIDEFKSSGSRFSTAIESTADEAQSLNVALSNLNNKLGDGINKEGLITETLVSMNSAADQLLNVSKDIQGITASFKKNMDSIDDLFKQVENALAKKFQ